MLNLRGVEASARTNRWLAIIMGGVVLWLVYGLALGSMPIILANVFTLVLALAVLVMKLRYG